MCTSTLFYDVHFDSPSQKDDATQQIIWPMMLEVILVIGDFKVAIIATLLHTHDVLCFITALTYIMQEDLEAIATGNKQSHNRDLVMSESNTKELQQRKDRVYGNASYHYTEEEVCKTAYALYNTNNVLL